ncbi:carboxylesterase family protein [Duganella sp. FT94W]|uniref:Carboxylic ester hydrolase n=1 Tax=Duganella lactea TaxID=2692173 RepID=A0ABW9V8Z1_9BURK|nr:carboxylesterase family protein [Duganella lactea]MYM35235.1 carboxylesterase family protein [Duganella lactea]
MKLSSLLLLSLAGATAWAGAAPVTVDGGQLEGVTHGGVVAYRGIPYAAAPVGPLRWRAPQPVVPWQGVRVADSYGNDCAQLPFPQDSAPLRTTPSEDCLYLNVWRPAASAAPRPVMVWIHGGGFVTGGSSPAVYDGAALASEGVVLVSLNYRLGRLGFFAHPALTAEHPDQPQGNYAVMDQLAALQWVQRNIARFGGDPGNVTIFGESAGGSAVGFLLATPMARGLFHKAIIESGALRYSLTPFGSATEGAQKQGVDFAAAAGVAGADTDVAALRALPTEALTRNVSFMSRDSTFSGPIRDGRLIPETPLAAFAAGRQAKVPLIIGSNSFEWGFMTMPGFPATAKPVEQVLAEFGPLAGQARKAYAGAIERKGLELDARLFSDRTFVEPSRAGARDQAAAGVPAYLYRFSYIAESERAGAPGALHATELPFVFGTVRARYGDRATLTDERISAELRARWIAFARNGAPQAPGLPAWPRYSGQRDQLLDIDTKTQVLSGVDRARLDVVEAQATR